MSEIIAISSIAYYILWFYKYSWALIFWGLTENNILKDIYIYICKFVANDCIYQYTKCY